jgi:3-hydroxyacyl-CoA dehydrogenase
MIAQANAAQENAARRQVYAELYMGLVETGVELLPGGGGCKEMTVRALDSGGPDTLRHHFETIAMAKASTSAIEARRLALLPYADGVTMNRERLVNDAKHLAHEIAKSGYAPPVPRTDIPAPGENMLATLKLGVHMMRQGEFISDHDVKVANRVAYVLCGGAVTPGTPVGEQYLLDLEREGFLSLCGERKTQARIAFTLKRGKPLRN